MPITGLTSPVGRIVSSNPGKSQTKKFQDGPNKGQPILKDGVPIEQWYFGVAFSKNDFNMYMKPHFDQEARTLFPQGIPPNFAWKYVDGDGVDSEGKPYGQREGYPGNIIVFFATEAFAPPIYKWDGQNYRQMQPDEIKCGHWISTAYNLLAHVAGQTGRRPGMYVNPTMLQHVGYAPEIQQTADPNAVFGRQQFQLPPGASATPISGAPAGVMPPQQYQQPATAPGPQYAPQPVQQPVYAPPGAPAPQGYPQQQPMQPVYGQPPQVYGQAPAAPVQGYPPPAHDFVQNAGQAPVQGYPAQPVQQPVYAPPGAPAPQYQQPVQGYPQQPGIMSPR